MEKEKLHKNKGCIDCAKNCIYNTLISRDGGSAKGKYGCNSSK